MEMRSHVKNIPLNKALLLTYWRAGLSFFGGQMTVAPFSRVVFRFFIMAVYGVFLSACALSDTVRGRLTDKLPIAADMEKNFSIDEKQLQMAIRGGEEIWTPAKRNQLQDAIIARSNYLCGLYQERLRQGRAHINFSLGVLATGAAGASAIVTGPLASDILAASAAFFTATRAEYNTTYFEQLSIHIVLKGIDSKRKAILKAIDERRSQEAASGLRQTSMSPPAAGQAVMAALSNDAVSTNAPAPERLIGEGQVSEGIRTARDMGASPSALSYTPARAVADAIRYHEACSVSAALEEASAKIEQASHPTLESAIDNLTMMRQLFEKNKDMINPNNPMNSEGLTVSGAPLNQPNRGSSAAGASGSH